MYGKRMLIRIGVAAALGAASLSAGCKNWRVTRTDPGRVKDYDYRFDEDDARQVAGALIPGALSKVDVWKAQNAGRDPLIVLGNVQNKTGDYVNSELFTDPIREALLNSGRVRIKAQKDLRQELRDERLDTEFNDPATVKAVAKEVNADFMLVGKVLENKEVRRDNKAVIQYYMVTMELINIETAETVWIDSHDLEKRAKRGVG